MNFFYLNIFIEKEESDSAEEDAEEKTTHNSLKMECRCGANNCRKILFG